MSATGRVPDVGLPVGFQLRAGICQLQVNGNLAGVEILGLGELRARAPRVTGLGVGEVFRGPLIHEGRPMAVRSLRVLEQRSAEDEVVLSAAFLDRSLESDRALASVLDGWLRAGLTGTARGSPEQEEQWLEPAQIEQTLTSLFWERATCWIRELSSPPETPGGWAARLNPDRRILLEWNAEGSGPKFPVEVTINGRLLDYRFELHADQFVGSRLARLPDRVQLCRRRMHRRSPAPASARVTLVHPHWGVRIERPLRDLAVNGIAFATDPTADLLLPGMAIDDLVVTWKNGPKVPLKGVVRHLSNGRHALGAVCGVSVEARDEEARELWLREVEGLLHPRTSSRVHLPDQLWELYEACGYFSLGDQSSGKFRALKPAFAAASKRLVAAQHLGCQVICKSDERVEGSVTLLKAWQHAWILYQVARQQQANPLAHSSNELLGELFAHGFEHACGDPDQRWFIAYIRRDARFSRMALLDFARRHDDGVRSSVFPFRAMEALCDEPHQAAPAPAGVSLREAGEVERDAMLRAFAQTHPRPYLEAYDLVPGRFGLEQIRGDWREAGLQRERRLLVAVRDGRAVAGAVLELIEEGIYLVGLGDAVRLVELEPGGKACFGALLHEARDYYRRHRKRAFVLFEESGDPAYALDAGLRDLGEAHHAVFSSALAPEFLEHIFQVTTTKPALID